MQYLNWNHDDLFLLAFYNSMVKVLNILILRLYGYRNYYTLNE